MFPHQNFVRIIRLPSSKHITVPRAPPVFNFPTDARWYKQML